jgi:hypothetical protein
LVKLFSSESYNKSSTNGWNEHPKASDQALNGAQNFNKLINTLLIMLAT